MDGLGALLWLGNGIMEWSLGELTMDSFCPNLCINDLLHRAANISLYF